MTKHPIKSAEGNLRITVMEPGWDGHVHLPGNLGLLRVVCGAYPDAIVNYVGGATQIELMTAMATPDIAERVQYTLWDVHLDKDTLPTDVWASLKRLRALPTELTEGADLIVLCSCTATILSAINWSGLASRSCTMLHGNANELAGWRSRNPLRSLFDLTGSLKRFCRNGGRVTVLENRIRDQMADQYPWLANSLSVIPHPLLPEEAGKPGLHRALNTPIHIGFAGRASIAKGFPDFLELARQLQAQRPGVFQFHAFGMLAEECAGLDQTVLVNKAKGTLTRQEYLVGLNSLHYIFAWHQDNYYGNAASGVVYDAVNLGIPMIARRSVQISEWAKQRLDIANSFDTVTDAVKAIATIDAKSEAIHYAKQSEDIEKLRNSLNLQILSSLFAKTFSMR